MFSLLGLFHEGRIVCPDRSHCTRPQCVFSHLADLPSPKLDIPVESPAPASPLSGRRVQSDASSIPAKRASSPLRRASEPSSSADEPPRKLLRVGSAQKHLAVPTASSSSASGPVLRVGAMHSQVPIPVRQTMLKSLYDHFSVLYQEILSRNPSLASEHALKQEEEVYKQSNKLTYRNAVIQCIAAIKRRDIPDSPGHPSVGTEAELTARVASKKAISSLRLTRDMLENLVLSEADLVRWGYITVLPSGPGGTRPTKEGIAKCDRCNQSFLIKVNPSDDECLHHYGKPLGRKINGEHIRIFNCCGKSSAESEGCVRGPHVFYENNPDDLHLRHPFSCLKPPLSPESGIDVVALDCEMIYTTGGFRVARVSVVDGSGTEIFDQFVRMDDGVQVIDYNTRFSGVTQELLDKALLPLASIRQSLDALINSNTILVGHALENDLKALRIIHYRCVDTAILFPHQAGPPYRRALRDLVREHLNINIQRGGGTVGHSSVEDSIATLDLVKWYILNKTNSSKILPQQTSHLHKMTNFESVRSFYSFIFHVLFLTTRENSPWTSTLLIWVVRLITVSVVLRTYVFPWVVTRLLRHVRVRSVSLRSIKGFYFRRGMFTCRVERITWSRTSLEESRRFTVKLEGFGLEIFKRTTPVPTEHFNERICRLSNFLTLRRLLFDLLSSLYTSLDPVFRPLIRNLVVGCLRLIIRRLPVVAQALSFEIYPATISFPGASRPQIRLENVLLHTSLALDQMDAFTRSRREAVRLTRPRSTSNVSAWKDRMAQGFRRSLGRALEKVKGRAEISVTIQDTVGTINSKGAVNTAILGAMIYTFAPIWLHGVSSPNLYSSRRISGSILHPAGVFSFLACITDTPSALEAFRVPNICIGTSVSFDAHAATIEHRGVSTRISIGDFVTDVTLLLILLEHFRPQKQTDMVPDGSDDLGFLPTATMLSPSSPMSPSTPSSSPLSPSSPLLDAINKSILPRRVQLQPCLRLRNFRHRGLLTFLNSLDIQVDSLKLVANVANNQYVTRVHNLGIQVGPSDCGHLHRRWLGQRKNPDNLDSDLYSMACAIPQVTLERQGRQILAFCGIQTQVVVRQWPSPWLMTGAFIEGDPNEPVLLFRLGVEQVELMESLESLLHLAQHLANSEGRPTNPGPIGLSLPRIGIEVDCGPICGHVVLGANDSSATLKIQTDGFSVSVGSLFTPQQAILSNKNLLSDFDHFPLHLSLTVFLVVRTTVIRVLSQNSIHKIDVAISDCNDHPCLLLCETVEISGQGHLSASVKDDCQSVASVDPTSLILDLQCSMDVFSVELWNPLVIAALIRLQQRLSANRSPASPASPSPLLDRLSPGLSATISVMRIVVFIAAPDLNPNDGAELSRGVALRATRSSFSYSSIPSHHVSKFKDLHHRSQTRHKLCLPEEQLMDAVAAAKTAVITNIVSAFFRASIPELSVRSALATAYTTDEPLIVEQDDPKFAPRDFLRLSGFFTDVKLAGCRGAGQSSGSDSCEISLRVSSINATLQLVHMYNGLLAFQTLKRLASTQSSSDLQRSSTPFSYSITTIVDTTQLLCLLPKQRVAFRVDSIHVKSSSFGPADLRFHRAAACVPLPSKINRWQSESGEKWHEALCVHRWTASFKSSGICVDVASIHIHIPFGYILADLVLDVGVAFKAVRHLFKITTNGYYTALETPEPEQAKKLPAISLCVGCLCAEADDDKFESQLALIWRTSQAAIKNRTDREEAFSAKVAAIIAAESDSSDKIHSQFSASHSVSIQEARERLDHVHSFDWRFRFDEQKKEQSRLEEQFRQKYRGKSSKITNLVDISDSSSRPPLVRMMMYNLALSLSNLSEDYLNLLKLPETRFSLLVPMHVNFTLSSLRISMRDYPLPLIDIPSRDDNVASFEFNSGVVIAEEMGTASSVDWISCPIVYPESTSAPFSIKVPKTIMPVKTYADAQIDISTSGVTCFSWGVSYGPATNDLMRVFDTLSSSSRDSSPVLGFWDKLRLIFHWTVRMSFKGDVHLIMKGSRDPYNISDAGAGFMLVWQGSPKLLIGLQNDDQELIQVVSDTMLIAIPDVGRLNSTSVRNQRSKPKTTVNTFKKVCAKFGSGIRFGVGFQFERTCGPECLSCIGDPFDRLCRFFDFRPHYDVVLEKKVSPPVLRDSYMGFRSDFVHLSISLASSLHPNTGQRHHPSSLHLTPKAFAHFWSWWALFDSTMTLPVRQGTYWPARTISPKFSRHLATIKYRVHVPHLFVMHAYIDDSRDTWADGITPWVGIRCLVEKFQVDMHQRDQIVVVADHGSAKHTKVLRRKCFYAAELVLKGLDLRALLATFPEPMKYQVPVASSPETSTYRTRNDLPSLDLASEWYDADDFIELDWSSTERPDLHILPVVSCPCFMYFRKNSQEVDGGKFGDEQTHRCLLRQQPSASEVQVALASARISTLKETGDSNTNKKCLHPKMIALLEQYVSHLKAPGHKGGQHMSHQYEIPSDLLSPEERVEFDNVYQIHCPKIVIDSAIRDIMIQYYYNSRARKGLEYHMAERAVKFIRDQANIALAPSSSEPQDHPNQPMSPQAAASMLRRILAGDGNRSHGQHRDTSFETGSLSAVDPLDGWSEGVSLRKSHCCLLLKPQVILRNRDGTAETCIVTAVQAKLQSFAIMDDSNADDPVSGKVMTRSYASLSGLQMFAPTQNSCSDDGAVPLEVLIDLRCESNDFDRLVPQTDAMFHYDKFNRLRLRNNVTTVSTRAPNKSTRLHGNHLQDQTDLILVRIPRFTATCNEQNFQTISNIVTKLLLFSDATQKDRLDRLQTLLISYDFTDLTSAARVVADLQERLRAARSTELFARLNPDVVGDDVELELLKLRAHIFLLTEELGFIFDAIKLAQDQYDQHSEKSALLLNASSEEISWRMLDDHQDLLAKLAVQSIDYHWLSRQDSSTVNNLAVGDLQAFDGSPNAMWTEILSKYDDHLSHSLSKRGLFLQASWSKAPKPIGGITIYERFELSLHPMRLQVDAKVGKRIMDYLLPARKGRGAVEQEEAPLAPYSRLQTTTIPSGRPSLESARPSQTSVMSPRLAPPLRRLGTSRSFTDLRSGLTQSSRSFSPLQRTRSSENLSSMYTSDEEQPLSKSKEGDAAVMRTRSSQKTFVYVRVSSLSLLLSVLKEDSFVFRDARIRTRDLEYHNQTCSFDELVEQFIPSDMSWKGWVKIALQQPLVPVLPVARELISKTKWLASSKSYNSNELEPSPYKVITNDPTPSISQTVSPHRGWTRKKVESGDRERHRTRVGSLFKSRRERPSLE